MFLPFIRASLLTLFSVAPLLPTASLAQSVTTTSTSSAQFTVPSSADIGFNVLPTIQDSEAPDPQASCPGYTASNVNQDANGFSADLTLAGNPCNAFGTDIQNLQFTVEYQSNDRVNINIQPSVLVSMLVQIII
jgi:alpha-glucosidase